MRDYGKPGREEVGGGGGIVDRSVTSVGADMHMYSMRERPQRLLALLLLYL